MAELQRTTCKCCGEPLDISKAVNGVIRCAFCDSVYIKAKEETKPAALNFLQMGEHDLDTCKFDDAYTAYAKAAELDPNEPEAWFGMALATFKVQYLKDEKPDTPPRLQPICHEISNKKFTENKNYLNALKCATPQQKQEYVKKAQEIDYILAEFYQLKNSGVDYDCFLCVKVSDENKGQTKDCQAAYDLYYHLKGKGYSPFFSETEIKNKVGADYEARILYALFVSECMLIVCSDEQYLHTKWVKNEYTRYMSLSENYAKERNNIAFAFRGTPIEKLPGRSGRIEGIDLNRPDAYSRIEEYISSFAPINLNANLEIARKSYGDNVVKKKSVARQGVSKRELAAIAGGEITISEQSKLNIVNDFLSRGDFTNAVRQCDVVLQQNAANGEAYWLRFLAGLRCKDEASFIGNKAEVTNFDDFEKAIAATKDEKRRKRFYSALYERACNFKDLYSYSEYIVLPESGEAEIQKLSDIMYRQALSRKDKRIFDEVIKTVTNTDKFVSMNLEFAHSLPQKEAIAYYKSILSADESHFESLYQVFAAEHNFNDRTIFTYCSNPDNSAVVEEKLFAFGYNSYASNCLLKLCLNNIATQTEGACKLFDFILTMIPKEKDKQFIEYLNSFIGELFENSKLKFISKYNELLLSLDKLSDNAYFNRVLLKHNYFNPIQLVEIADALLDDEDYFSALNSFTEKNPNKPNLYIDIKDAIIELAGTIKLKDCLEFIAKKVYYKKEELLTCKNQVFKLLSKEANNYFQAFLKECNCSSAQDVFNLQTDVTDNANLKMARTFAIEAQDGSLVAKIEKIYKEQPQACLRNIRADKNRQKTARVETIKHVFSYIYLCLAMLSMVAVYYFEIPLYWMLVANAVEIVLFLLLLRSSEKYNFIPIILFALLSVAMAVYGIIRVETFLPNLQKIKAMADSGKISAEYYAGALSEAKTSVITAIVVLILVFISLESTSENTMASVILPLAMIGCVAIFMLIFNAVFVLNIPPVGTTEYESSEFIGLMFMGVLLAIPGALYSLGVYFWGKRVSD